MDHKTVGLLITLVLLVVQWVYNYKRNKENTALETKLDTLTELFRPEIEKANALIKGVAELQAAHEKEMEIYGELIKLTHTIALTQKHIAKLMERSTDDMEQDLKRIEEHLVSHQEQCREQFHVIDKKIKEEA